MTLEYLVSQYGYSALFIGVFLEGETILILAGFAAHLGHLSLTWVILTAFAGSLAGDQFYFFLGRLKGKTFLQKRPGWETKAKRVWALFEHYRTLLLLGFRFMYGLRTVTPFAIGLSGISGIRFLGFNMIGAAIWSAVVAFVGYLFGAVAPERPNALPLSYLGIRYFNTSKPSMVPPPNRAMVSAAMVNPSLR